MNTQFAGATLAMGLVLTALAPPPAQAVPQPIIPTPATTPLLPNILYELAYATAGKITVANTNVVSDTIVSLGIAGPEVPRCNLQLAWYDWDGTPAGVSGGTAATVFSFGRTLEFTTSINRANVREYPPIIENVLRSTGRVFEGYAEIRSDCQLPLRVDAEFATTTTTAGNPLTTFKPIRVTGPRGLVGD